MIKLFPKDKAGLNRRGHPIFAAMLLSMIIMGAYYYFNYSIVKEIILKDFYFNSALILTFIFSSTITDKFEPSYPYVLKKVSHRQVIHSWRSYWFTIWILIPLTIWLAFAYSRFYLFITAVLFSHLSHIWGDYMSGHIPK